VNNICSNPPVSSSPKLPPTRGRVIVEFGIEGPAVPPIAETDDHELALLDALRIATETGDFAEFTKRSGQH
jgi:hypothetical protein